MTIICALCDTTSKEVWLGCNDGVTLGNTRMPGVHHPKWRTFGGWALGISGGALIGDVVDAASDNFPTKDVSPSAIVQFLRAVLNEREIGTNDEDDNSINYAFSAILARRDGRIWDVDSYLTLAEVQPGTLWARGSGMEYALGADFPLAGCEVTAEERIRNAVDAAIYYDTVCPGEPIIEQLI